MKISFIISVILSAIVIGLMIPWAVILGKAIAEIDKTSCAVYYTFENIIEGVSNNEMDYKFPGLRGLEYFALK